MVDNRTKAFVNFHAAMGALERYVELDAQAKEIAKKWNLTVRFNVKGGPDGLIVFDNGKIQVLPNDGRPVSIHLYCANPDQFNAVVDGKAMPIPVKGIFKTLKFMGKPESDFNVLTGKMAALMRKTEFTERAEMVLSTELAFYTMVAALAEIANYDPIGMLAAKRIPEGEIGVEIKGLAAATLFKKDGKFYCRKTQSKNPRSLMVFSDVDVAKGLIDGKVDAMSCISEGTLELKGFVPMLENLNKVLNLVPKYLA